jgi:flagellar motor switch protein FliG
VCLSRQAAPNPVLLARITQALLVKARTLSADPGANEPAARYQKIADLIRSLEKVERNEILNALQEQEPEAATRVKDLLYQFEDLLRIIDRSMQKLLSSLDSKTLSVALKGAPEAIAAKVLNNLSMRAREGIEEEIELLGTVPPSQVRQAQKVVVDLIQRLDQAGELQMSE